MADKPACFALVAVKSPPTFSEEETTVTQLVPLTEPTRVTSRAPPITAVELAMLRPTVDTSAEVAETAPVTFKSDVVISISKAVQVLAVIAVVCTLDEFEIVTPKLHVFAVIAPEDSFDEFDTVTPVLLLLAVILLIKASENESIKRPNVGFVDAVNWTATSLDSSSTTTPEAPPVEAVMFCAVRDEVPVIRTP